MIKATRETLGDLDTVLVWNSDAFDPTGPDSPAGVVVLCHGFGAGGDDLVPIAGEWLAAEQIPANTLLVFPAAPLKLDPFMDMRAWWPIDMEKIQQLMVSGETRELRNDVPDRLRLCRDLITRLIDLCRARWMLPAGRVVIGGFSQGAMLTTDTALHYPEALGGLIVWSGNLINEAGWRVAAQQQDPLHVFQSHGRSDPILPFVGAELLRELLTETGHTVQFVEFPGPHTIPPAGMAGGAELIRAATGDE